MGCLLQTSRWAPHSKAKTKPTQYIDLTNVAMLYDSLQRKNHRDQPYSEETGGMGAAHDSGTALGDFPPLTGDKNNRTAGAAGDDQGAAHGMEPPCTQYRTPGVKQT